MKRDGFTASSDVHRDCWELLPWIANERASAADLAFAEAHLRDCSACREELETQRRLRDAIRSQEAVVLAPQTSLQKLMQRIDSAVETDAEARQPEPASATATPRPAVIRWSRWLPIAAGLQGLAITVLLAALWWQSSQILTEPRFTTLTSHTRIVTHGPVIRVVFAQGVKLDDVKRILHSIDAQIVAGPSEAGVYTLGLVADAAHPASVEDALATLRSDKRVVFSESALARTDPP